MQGTPDTHRTCSLLPRPPAPTDHPPAEPGSQAENAHRDHPQTAPGTRHRAHRERPSREATTQTTQPTPPNPETWPTHPHQPTAGLGCEPQGRDSRPNPRRPGKHGQGALTRAAHTTAETHRAPHPPKPPQTTRRTAPNPTPGSAQRNTHSAPPTRAGANPPRKHSLPAPPAQPVVTRKRTPPAPRACHRAGTPNRETNETRHQPQHPPRNPNAPRRDVLSLSKGTTLKPTIPRRARQHLPPICRQPRNLRSGPKKR